MRNFILLTAMPLFAVAYDTTSLHSHHVYVEGVLPEPYKTVSLEIDLDPENDDLKNIALNVDGKWINFPESEKAKLIDLDLHTMKVEHGIFSAHDSEMSDVLYVKIAKGERKSLKCNFDKEELNHGIYDVVLIQYDFEDPPVVRLDSHINTIMISTCGASRDENHNNRRQFTPVPWASGGRLTLHFNRSCCGR